VERALAIQGLQSKAVIQHWTKSNSIEERKCHSDAPAIWRRLFTSSKRELAEKALVSTQGPNEVMKTKHRKHAPHFMSGDLETSKGQARST
jgi:hypothetical protein